MRRKVGRDSPKACEPIHFAIRESKPGFVLVAVSSKGICAVLFGNDPEELAAKLARYFPDANCMEGGKAPRLADKVVMLIESPAKKWALPLDIRGTNFQKRVWKAVQKIPPGKTASYGDVARSIGMPRAARAVATAIGACLLSIAVPCHRVVSSSGSLTGHHMGVARRRILLRAEGSGF